MLPWTKPYIALQFLKIAAVFYIDKIGVWCTQPAGGKREYAEPVYLKRNRELC